MTSDKSKAFFLSKFGSLATTNTSQMNFEQSEQIRKLQLVRVLSLIMSLVDGSIAVTYTGFWFMLNQPGLLAGAALSLVLSFGLAINAQTGQSETSRTYRLRAWVVVGATMCGVSCNCILGSISLGLALLFMIPLALAVALLRVGEVVGVMVLSMAVLIGWYINQTWLGWFKPLLNLNANFNTLANIFIIILVIPPVIALLIAPVRSQLRTLRSQNERLERVLEQLEIRQQTGQAVSQQVLTVVSQLTTIARQQSIGSQEQTNVIIQADSSLTELSGAASHIAELVEQVNQAAQTVATDSSRIEETTDLTARQSAIGLDAVQETVSVTGQSAILYQQLADTMYELNAKNAKLHHILDLLSSIAGETHLLALNAVIEAASAGEYGNRFSVIAQEVKQLADRSARANRDVLGIVAEIEESTATAVKAAQDGYIQASNIETIAYRTGTVIEEMGQTARQAQTQANAISQASHSVKELTQIIWAAMAQQRIASAQVLQALKGLSVVAEQGAEGSNLVSTTAVELEQLSQRLNRALAV